MKPKLLPPISLPLDVPLLVRLPPDGATSHPPVPPSPSLPTAAPRLHPCLPLSLVPLQPLHNGRRRILAALTQRRDALDAYCKSLGAAPKLGNNDAVARRQDGLGAVRRTAALRRCDVLGREARLRAGTSTRRLPCQAAWHNTAIAATLRGTSRQRRHA